MVRVGLLFDQLRPDERLIIDAAKRESINLVLSVTSQLAWNVTGQWDGIELADAFLRRCMSFFRSIHTTAALEAKGKPVVNSYKLDHSPDEHISIREYPGSVEVYAKALWRLAETGARSLIASTATE